MHHPALRHLPRFTATLLLSVAALVTAPVVHAIGDEIAVAARVFNDYQRVKLPNGTFQPETFTFGDGGRYDAAIADPEFDKVTFLQVARELIGPLAERGYVQSADPQNTQLLILVFWGTMRGTADPYGSPYSDMAQAAMQSIATVKLQNNIDSLYAELQRTASAFDMLAMENNLKYQIDRRNAGILGFQTELWRAETTFGTTASADFYSELRADRYFVVLKAYDFKVAWKEKRRKILWEARFSIRQRGSDFREQLPAMATFASDYFGKRLDNLLRRPLPEPKIEYGEPRMIKYE